MNSSAAHSVIAFSLLTVSTAVFAGANMDAKAPEGVVVNLTDVMKTAGEPAATRLPNAVTDASGKTIAGVKTGEAMASEPSVADEAENDVLEKIVDAIRPKRSVPALENDRFELYLSEKVLFGQFERSAARHKLEKARVHFGLLYSEERDSVVQGGLALDASYQGAFRLSFGTRAYIALLGEENMDVLAAALGAETAYQLPFEALPLELGASIYYAPDILTFGGGDRAIDVRFDLSLPVRPQLTAFTGVRFLQVDTLADDREIDNRAHMGVRWDFL